MNKFEKIIYDRVRFSPKLKQSVVDIYQLIFSIFPIKNVQSNYEIIARDGYFYGFHDKCPWSEDNKYILAHKYNDDLIVPNKNDKVKIGYFSGEKFTEFTDLDSTTTWNWQMGSMLQWFGENIIFNDHVNGKHIAKIIDKNGTLLITLPRPISALDQNANIALSHSFVRLRTAAPAYGYANGNEFTEDDPLPENDGIYSIDLSSKKTKMLYSIAEIAKYKSHTYPEDAYHYFTHSLFSPSGKRFAFYHRYIDKTGKTWTRLLTSNTEGTDLHLFNFSGVVTHLAWQDDEHILAYGLKDDVGDNYYLLEDKTNNYEIVGRNIFKSDGHPQFSPNKEFFVTDTYPDRFRRQYLSIYNMNTEMYREIAILKSGLKFKGNVRCDLHPRWDRIGKFISFDSAHTGTRALCTIELMD